MDKKFIEFDNTGIEEFEFHQYKSLILLNDIDINKIVVSNKIPFGKEDFNISLVTKILRKLNTYAYSIRE